MHTIKGFSLKRGEPVHAVLKDIAAEQMGISGLGNHVPLPKEEAKEVVVEAKPKPAPKEEKKPAKKAKK